MLGHPELIWNNSGCPATPLQDVPQRPRNPQFRMSRNAAIYLFGGDLTGIALRAQPVAEYSKEFVQIGFVVLHSVARRTGDYTPVAIGRDDHLAFWPIPSKLGMLRLCH